MEFFFFFLMLELCQRSRHERVNFLLLKEIEFGQ